MKTNIDIDDELVKDAMKALGVKTKKEAVEAGLKEILRRERIKKVAESEGIGWGWDDYLEKRNASEKPKTKRSSKKRENAV